MKFIIYCVSGIEPPHPEAIKVTEVITNSLDKLFKFEKTFYLIDVDSEDIHSLLRLISCDVRPIIVGLTNYEEYPYDIQIYDDRIGN